MKKKLTITADLTAKEDLPKTFAKELARSIKSTLPDDLASLNDIDVKVGKIAVTLE